MAAADVLEYDVTHEIRGSLVPGRLKFHRQGVIFKNQKNGKIDQIAASEIDSSKWLRVPQGHQVKFYTANGEMYKFDGFKEQDHETLKDYVESYFSQKLISTEMSTKGWNWGRAAFNGKIMSFDVGGVPAFEIPLNNVMKSTVGKNEVSVEFHQNDDVSLNLMEMKFYIPPNTELTEEPTETFHKNIMSHADIIQVTGDAIVTFPEIFSLTPRGKYDIKMFPTFLHLHGKTYDYKLPYKTILRLFLLPHKDDRAMFFVISLDPPIKQGQTRYPYITLQFNKEEEITVNMNMDEEELKEKFDGKLQQEMSGPMFEVVSRIMKSLIQRKITVPGGFTGNSGNQAISCSHRTSNGFLYPLEKGFFYVHKPAIHVRFDEVSSVHFARAEGSSRFFEIEVETKSGVSYTFSSIEKNEYGNLYDFVKKKNLRMLHRGDTKARIDDSASGSDEDVHDAYLQKVKREGKEKFEVDNNDDSDSDDEDFKPVSESDVAEEFDSAAEPSSGSDKSGVDGEPVEKKVKKEKKPKMAKVPREKKTRTSKKAKKDPNLPKKPLSAYMLWMIDKRPSLKEEVGNSITLIAKRAGELWKTITDSDKSIYENKAAVLKAEYAIKMKDYKANEGKNPSLPVPVKKKVSGKTGTASPKKAAGDFKSKEFISSSDDEDAQPKKADVVVKAEKKDKVKVEVAKPEDTKEMSESDSEDEDESEEEKPTIKMTRSKRGQEVEELAELPSDEEILEGRQSDEGTSTGESSGE